MTVLKGKSVLVTGSSAGIGKAIAAAFLHRGAIVYVNGRDRARIEETVSEFAALGDARPAPGDVGTADGADAAFAASCADAPLDILVNNVGIYQVQAFEEIDDRTWQHYFDVNVMSAIRLARHALPDMLRRHSGRIVNVASEAGVQPMPQMIHYSVTKSALIALSRGLAELTKGTGVTVNCVIPGPAWTDRAAAHFEAMSSRTGTPVEQLVTQFFHREEPTSLIQRFVRLEEIAETVVFIAGMSAATGAAYRLDGGLIRSIL